VIGQHRAFAFQGQRGQHCPEALVPGIGWPQIELDTVAPGLDTYAAQSERFATPRKRSLIPEPAPERA
jgi:hypothetical protein